ncbi:activator of the mannose operon (transcriptional antiterminator) [Evansella vedderi]|uniref:Activator of the mannose operon (Transcriptional antiterminator) n=1 Tax=Evansella vedderi TaxID=38282 RepID=A0ABT9ZPV3_9BACI|nr:BglG family transcription antiterminator [Evansella vedderi]MDQ0252980.1 activator of the mannose operon (transcriptional antiterminator) [Evansella vedderi]
MDDRQKKILQLFLMDPDRNLLVQEIADRIAVSEKTVRNDFKEIDRWLRENSTATLVRKRSKGVSLELTEDERKRLIKALNIVDMIEESFEEDRLLEILKFILNKNKTFTIQELADRYYVSKQVIKKDLSTIEDFLRLSDLKLTTKQKIGIIVEGEELNRRNALLRFLELYARKKSDKQTMMSSLFEPNEYAFVEREVRKINELLPIPLADEALTNVVVHVLIAVQRMKLKNPIELFDMELAEIKGKEEYRLAEELAKKLESFFKLKIPEKEVVYISLRILGGKRQSPYISSTVPIQMEDKVQEFITNLIDRVGELSNVSFETDKQLVNGLSIHLHSTFNRLRYELPIANPMVSDIKKMYPYMFGVIYSVIIEMDDPIFSEMPEDEMAYLTLHFQSALERLNKLKGQNKRALIVCSMGIGMSQLLQTKLERRFDSLEIKGCVSFSQLKKMEAFEGIDFIITTIPVDTEIPSIEISPLMFDYEQQKIEYFIKKLDGDSGLLSLRKLVKEEFIYLHVEGEHRYEVIEKVATALYESGVVKQEYIKSCLDRERTSSTAIGGGLAIPHGNPKEIITPVVAVATLEKPIDWGNETVSMIFLLGNKFAESKTTKKLFQDLSNLSENPLLVEKLTKQTDKRSFLSLL